MHPKPEFQKRIEQLLGQNTPLFFECLNTPPSTYFRTNTLKIEPNILFERLQKKWKIERTIPNHPEIIRLCERDMLAIGKSMEHQLGYFYIQDLASMMAAIALNPMPGETILDLAAAPGSKTTQIAAYMQNQGVLLANEPNDIRIKALHANIERMGVSCAIISRNDGGTLTERLLREGILMDRILLDAPCSGEGIIQEDKSILKRWSMDTIHYLAQRQKRLLQNAWKALKPGGTLVYSTCSLAPEENEVIVQSILHTGNATVEPITLPIKTQPGILEWEGHSFDPQIKNCVRIYPHENDSIGFFVAKIIKILK